jgi:hypothetical protein
MGFGELKEWRLFKEMWRYFGDKGHVYGEVEKVEV